MIFSGFPCIGKSSVASSTNRCIDLESSMFFGSDGIRPSNWVELYVNIAQDLHKQGYVVLVSSHKAVREEMTKRRITFSSVFPSIELKEQWGKRLAERYNSEPTEKNKRAMDYIMSHYEESIEDMKKDSNPIEIRVYPYELERMISLVE